jgi:Flp pilus assembly protein TadB
LDCGYSHVKTVIIIYLYSMLTVAASLLSYYLNPSLALFAVLACSVLFILFVHLAYKSALKRKNSIA